MTNYSAVTKILLVDSQDASADSVSGSSANTVTTYIETLDSTTNQIISVTETPVSNNKTRVCIIHKG